MGKRSPPKRPPMETPHVTHSVYFADGIGMFTTGDDVMAENMLYTFYDQKNNVSNPLPPITKKGYWTYQSPLHMRWKTLRESRLRIL